jgi:hypothetical protein
MPVNIIAPYLLTALLPGPRRLVYLSSSSHYGGRRSTTGIDWRGQRATLLVERRGSPVVRPRGQPMKFGAAGPGRGGRTRAPVAPGPGPSRPPRPLILVPGVPPAHVAAGPTRQPSQDPVVPLTQVPGEVVVSTSGLAAPGTTALMAASGGARPDSQTLRQPVRPLRSPERGGPGAAPNRARS